MEQVAKLKRTWNLASVVQTIQKIPEKYCPCLYLAIEYFWWVNEVKFKRYIRKCTQLHVLIPIRRHRFGKSWNGKKCKNLNILRTEHAFLRNKKVLNLYLRWHISRSYRFGAEVTFKYLDDVLKTHIFQQYSGEEHFLNSWLFINVLKPWMLSLACFNCHSREIWFLLKTHIHWKY